ncbi:MAG: DUF599 domain-containing protein [Candidatus Hydrothermarchaeota archaeon]|jgi:uncharacterized membrane protein|nr:DUF599 domain-containing protein [Candidatus Hydrothermarchaeota archaeon]
MSPLDIAGLVIFFLCSVVYHSSYYLVMRHYPQHTVKTRINLYRRAWVEHILRTKDYHLAVLQARGLININTFLASASLIFIGVILNLLVNTDKVSGLGLISLELFEIKIMLIVVVYSFSFFSFLSSLRNLRIFTMLIPTPRQVINKHSGIKAVDYFTRKVNKASGSYTLGSRSLYYSIPVFLWLVSPWLFILSTLVMTAYFALRKDYRFREKNNKD